MEEKISYAVKVSPGIREKIKAYCYDHGIKQGYFVEKALEEKLRREEDMEDALEFRKWQHQESQAITFEQYLKKRNV